MRLLLLSRGGSSRLFNHGDMIIFIHGLKWLEITSPFRKCVSGMEQLLAHGLEPATLSFRSHKSGELNDCATTGTNYTYIHKTFC